MGLKDLFKEMDRHIAEKRREESMYRWRYKNGMRATSRCVNASKYFPGHKLSDDGKCCLACGAIRVLRGRKRN